MIAAPGGRRSRCGRIAGWSVSIGGTHAVRVHTAESADRGGGLQGISSAMSVQNAAAAVATTGAVPAAADEVSALTAAQFAKPRCITPSAPDGLRLARCS
jgi:PE family